MAPPPSELTNYDPNAKTDVTLYSQLLKLAIYCDVGFDPAWCNQAQIQGVFFNWPPPKKLEYKIPLYPLALREISDQLTWDLVL